MTREVEDLLAEITDAMREAFELNVDRCTPEELSAVLSQGKALAASIRLDNTCIRLTLDLEKKQGTPS
jgi:hypothetical protein